ncbi:serine hydrolase domain-containing protein [Nonomuraea sp. NPDC004580]|uniref:serine hydrolase domain-containing protein n=1 Tax=Nonomuraea sp. NPDC004580 TaxID=3154552 RepID=UPI0033ABBE71
MKRAKAAGLAGVACAMLTLGTTAPATATAATGTGTGTDRPKFGEVQKALTELAASSKIVGAIGAVYVDGKRVAHGTGGTRLLDDKGGKIPPSARYRIGSQTKLMTGTVILQLVKEKKLALDDKLSDLLPIVVEQDLVKLADQITLQQLLQHTSGIPNLPAADVFDMTYHTPLEMVKRTSDLKRTGEPGAQFNYSNTNYFLLGLIIERYTKHTVSAEFERRLFDKLDMDRTYLPTQPPGGIKGPHGHGYYPDKDGRLRDVDRQSMSHGYAAAGVISTTEDLSAFHRALVKNELLPKELTEVLLGRLLPKEQSARSTARPAAKGPICDGQGGYFSVTGGGPGGKSITYNTADGRVQFALSTTLGASNLDPDLDPLMEKAAEAVLCPSK